MAGGFHSLGLMPEILKAVDELGWLLPTDVQDESIPLILGGGDVMVAAETGSGKTAAFCLPILQCVSERLRSSESNQSIPTNEKSNSSTIPTIHDVKINENDKDSLLIIEGGGLLCSSAAEKLWVGGRATHGVKQGKYYYEATVKGTGICRFGWSTMAAHYEIGKDAYGFGFGGSGMKSFNGTFEAYGVKYVDGAVIGCLLDLEKREISYSINGINHGVAFILPETLINTIWFPAFVFKGAGASFNFGNADFKYLPSSEYSNIVHAHPSHVISSTSKEAYTQSSNIRLPVAIVLEPSRELAEQVDQNIDELSRYIVNPKVESLLIVGGEDNKKISKTLSKGCDIIVGTLGKISECVKSKILDLSQIRFFILDEADRMTESDSLAQIMTLYAACPVGGTGDNRLQVCFFSATLHSFAITNLASKICVNPTWVDLKGIDSVPETVHHVICDINIQRHISTIQHARIDSILDNVQTTELINQTIAVIKKESARVKSSDTSQQVTPYTSLFASKDNSKINLPEVQSLLIKAIKQQILIQIIDKFNMSQCMIFCRTNLDCDNLETFLCALSNGQKLKERMETGKEHAYSCCVLGGMRSMEERRRSLEAFKAGEVRFLICTDVAARGIDVQGLPFMINMTLPDESENYIHRIGRVGRADRMGLAISLVNNDPTIKEKVWYHICKNRGKGCTDRKLKSDGGCTIWYEESHLLQDIQRRLQMTDIPVLKDDFSLPDSLADLNVVYGELSGNVSNTLQGSTYQLHTSSLSSALQELTGMEYETQNIFLKMQNRFN